MTRILSLLALGMLWASLVCAQSSLGNTMRAPDTGRRTVDIEDRWLFNAATNLLPSCNPPTNREMRATVSDQVGTTCVNNVPYTSGGNQTCDVVCKQASVGWTIAGESPNGGGPLTVTMTGAPTAGPTTLTPSFVATPSGGTPPYTYSWTFGDGGTATTQNPSHGYTSTGTYTATVIVTDNVGASVSATKSVLATGATYYVAKTGSDSNNGTSPSTAFLTLTKCQTAMQSGLKVCTVNDSGTYTLTANLAFTASDVGETWIAGFGQTPIIDGSSNTFYITMTAASTLANPFSMYGFTFNNMGVHTDGGPAGSGSVLLIGGTNYTFRWNIFNNAVGGSSLSNDNCNGGSADTFDSNTFNGSTWPTTFVATYVAASIFLCATQGNIQVTHNLLQNAAGALVNFNTSTTGQSNNTISLNKAINAIQHCTDCGTYYMFDTSNGTSPTSATGNQIINNVAYINSDPELAGVGGVYLDTYMANVTVTGNIVTSYNAGANGGLFNNARLASPGENCFSINITGNIFKNNICELGNAAAAYGDWYDCSQPASYPFTCANTFEKGTHISAYPVNVSASPQSQFKGNIVFTRGAWNADGPWTLISANPLNAPIISGNDWFSQTAATYPPAAWNAQCTWRNGNSTNFCDSAPVTSNPGFVNPSANNYDLTSAPNGWVAIPHGQGPIDSPFVNN